MALVEPNISQMDALRRVAAFLGCLAVLAGGVATVAAAAPVDMPIVEQSSANVPCSHCPDCDGIPCPMSAADCLQVSLSAAPALVAAAVELPQIGSVVTRWILRSAMLSGLSLPPDPFPPRI